MSCRRPIRAPSRRSPLSLSLFLLISTLPAQTGNTILQAVPAEAVAGGIVDLYVAGVGATLTAPVAAGSFPLPTTLAGISVALTQLAPPQQLQVPILAIRPMSTCANQVAGWPPCSRYAVVTIQIPQEFGGSDMNLARLVVSENGVAGGAVEMGQWEVVRVLAITHGDGTAIYPGHPAKVGEELVVWAANLGPTAPTVPTGQATPSPAPVTRQTPRLNFDYRPNAAPSRPYCPAPSGCSLPNPAFSGLTPGYAGLYQVNFIVPEPPLRTPPCNDESFSYSNLANVASNLTVSVITLSSFDGAGICVDTTASGSPGGASAAASDARTPRTVNVPDSVWFPRGLDRRSHLQPNR